VLISFVADIVAAGYTWPWQDRRESRWPRLAVMGLKVLIGALVSAAMASQVTGPWPAFLLGITAPSVVRGTLDRIEVTEQKPGGDDDASLT
jgi:uncharacterized membrane protein YfcA